MFRYARPRRGMMAIFSTARLPLRLEAQIQQGKALNSQRVTLQEKRISARRILLGGLIMYVCIQVFDKLVFGILEDKIGELPQGEEEKDSPLFIPFPGTTNERIPPPYKETDPEFQEFLKFNRDPAMQRRAKDELAQHVRRFAESYFRAFAQKPALRDAGVAKDLKLNRSWLVIEYPRRPPPEFVRSGIEISDDAISWVTAPVDRSVVSRHNRILQPTAVAKSVWEFTKTVYMVESRRFAGMLGIQSQTPPPSPINQLLGFKGSGQGPHGSPQAPGAAVDGKSSVMNANAPAGAGSEQKGSSEAEVDLQKARLENHNRFTVPLRAFRRKLLQSRGPTIDYPPRGSIWMSGMLEFETAAAYLIFDVRAAWDPKERAYDLQGIQVAPRGALQLKKKPSELDK